MICPQCGGDTAVTGHLRRNDQVHIHRARQCLHCGNRFETIERYHGKYAPRIMRTSTN